MPPSSLLTQGFEHSRRDLIDSLAEQWPSLEIQDRVCNYIEGEQERHFKGLVLYSFHEIK